MTKKRIYRIVAMLLFIALPYFIASVSYFSMNIGNHPPFIRFLEAIFTILAFGYYMKIKGIAAKLEEKKLIDFGIWLDKNDIVLENGNITESVRLYLKENI